MNDRNDEVKMLNFVADAFIELRADIRAKIANGYNSASGLKPEGFLADFDARRGYTDVQKKYSNY